MIKEIVHDPVFLAGQSVSADKNDISVADDLADTLTSNREKCVGMAANMIGVQKNIIVFFDNGKIIEMFNPEIVSVNGKYETEEGCLSLSGTRKAVRYKLIRVKWQTRDFRTKMQIFSGWTAQIIQHEIDHTKGVLI